MTQHLILMCGATDFNLNCKKDFFSINYNFSIFINNLFIAWLIESSATKKT